MEAVSVEAIGKSDAPAESFAADSAARSDAAGAARNACACSAATQWHDTGLFKRADMRPGDIVKGPAIIAEDNATTVVEPGWQAQVTPLQPPGADAASKRCRSGAPSAPRPTR